jgi:hypothetical protein
MWSNCDSRLVYLLCTSLYKYTKNSLVVFLICFIRYWEHNIFYQDVQDVQHLMGTKCTIYWLVLIFWQSTYYLAFKITYKPPILLILLLFFCLFLFVCLFVCSSVFVCRNCLYLCTCFVGCVLRISTSVAHFWHCVLFKHLEIL